MKNIREVFLSHKLIMTVLILNIMMCLFLLINDLLYNFNILLGLNIEVKNESEAFFIYLFLHLFLPIVLGWTSFILNFMTYNKKTHEFLLKPLILSIPLFTPFLSLLFASEFIVFGYLSYIRPFIILIFMFLIMKNIFYIAKKHDINAI